MFVGREAEQVRCAGASEELRLIAIYGVAGVGKTALMLRVAHALASRVEGHLVYRRCRSGETLATVARGTLTSLASVEDGRARGRCRYRTEELVSATEQQALVICLDDAHRVNCASFIEQLGDLAARHLPLWLLVASREELPFDAARVDHLVVRLQGLGEAEAAALWQQLESLYGPPAVALSELLANTTASPLLLKQAFNSGVPATPADPMGLGGLGPLPSELLLELALHRRPVSVVALERGRDPPAVADALRCLTRRFLVEPGGPGRLAIHDLVRDAVESSLPAPSERLRRRCLDYCRAELEESPGDDETELEVLHHALGCNDDDLARKLLLKIADASRIIPVGAVAERELVADLAELARRGPMPRRLRLLSARLAARQGELQHAYAAAREVAEEDDVDGAVEAAEVAYLMGRLDEALAWVRRATACTSADVPLRAWVIAVQAACLRDPGRLQRARRFLRAGAPAFAALGPLGESMRLLLKGVLAYECEDYVGAGDRFAEVVVQLKEAGATVDDVPLFSSLRAAARVRQGGGPAPRSEMLVDHSLFFRLVAEVCRAEEALARGEMREAAGLAAGVRTAAREVGYVVVELGALVTWAEASRILGRGQEVRGDLEEGIRRAEEVPLPRHRLRMQTVLARILYDQGELERAAERSQAALDDAVLLPGTARRLRSVRALATAMTGDLDAARQQLRDRDLGRCTGYDEVEWRLSQVAVLQWDGRAAEVVEQARRLGEEVARNGWRWLECRARLLEAEGCYHLSDVEGAARALRVASAQADEAGYAVESVHRWLLEGALARARGNVAAAEAAWQRGAAQAQQCELPVERVAASVAVKALRGRRPKRGSSGGQLARRLHLGEPVTCRLRTKAGTVGLTPEHGARLDGEVYDLYADLVTGRVWHDRRWVDLSSHEILAAVLAALLEDSVRGAAPATIMERVWGMAFHPMRHRGRVSVAVCRLRQLVGRDLIEQTAGHYRVMVPDSWAVLEPLPPEVVAVYRR